MTGLSAKNLLKGKKTFPKKRLGQNFLCDRNIIGKMIETAGLTREDSVLEIGPGTGNLTREIAKTAGRAAVVEFDPKMVEILKETLKDFPAVEIIEIDILKFDEKRIKPPYKVVSNLPFYLAAPVIRKFLESGNPPESLTVIVQKEVAQRITAKPPRMSILAVAVQYYAAAGIGGYISKNCFWPAPKVDCAILKIVPDVRHWDEKFDAGFFKIVKAGFSQPRKQLAGNFSKNLKIPKREAEAWMRENAIDPARRAETLSVEQWIGLARSFPKPDK